MVILKCYVIPFTGSKLKITPCSGQTFVASHDHSIDMTVDCSKTVRQSHRAMYFEGFCMCMCVFCACATIPSEIQSCDVPLIYTIPPNAPIDFTDFFCYFYKIKNSAPSDIKETALIFFYVELQ